MKQFFVFVLFNILLISISTLQANEVQEPSPFFAWSSSNHIVGKNIYSSGNYETSDLTNILLSTVDSQFTSEFINKESQPELIVIYHGDSDLRSDIKSSFAHSKTSFSLPYAYPVNSVSSIQSLANYAQRVLVIGESDISIENSENVDFASLAREIASGSLIDGKVDVIIVSPENIHKIENLLSKEKNVLSFLISDSKDLDITINASKKIFLPMKITGETAPYSSLWPAYVVEGILTSALLIFFLLVAVIYTSKVQSPDQFESKKVQQSNFAQ